MSKRYFMAFVSVCGASDHIGRAGDHRGVGCVGATRTIQVTPKRSETTPKREEKKVLERGWLILPASARALNARSAWASFATVSEREMPWNAGWPLQWQSLAITTVSPMRKLECITLL